jgi:UDP-N-acetylglucosamine acyltransferase
VARVHPSAVVSSSAELADDVEVGAFVLIGDDVRIGAGTIVGPFTRIEGPTEIGEGNEFFGHASIGSPPQDLKYAGAPTRLVIGNHNRVREFVTINRGTEGGGGITTIGDDNFFMAYSHVAHDCYIGSHTIFANNATLAGHVTVGDYATIGAFSAVHQFCHVGEHAFVGGGTMCTQDVLPYVKSVSPRDNKTYGVNTIGLTRKGFPKETVDALQHAYKMLVHSKTKLDETLQRIDARFGTVPEVQKMIAFIRKADRGFILR